MNKDNLDNRIIKDENLKMVTGGSGFDFDDEKIEVHCSCCGLNFFVVPGDRICTCPFCGRSATAT